MSLKNLEYDVAQNQDNDYVILVPIKLVNSQLKEQDLLVKEPLVLGIPSMQIVSSI